MLNTLKKDIDKELNRFLQSSDIMAVIKQYSPILHRGIKDFVKRPGKRIRPVLTVIGYLGYTRKRKPDIKGLIRSAVSMELLHDFLLIHDDIIDNSNTRRGKPSLHQYFNTAYNVPFSDKLGCDLGIIAGDIIFSAAIKELLTVKENANNIKMAVSVLADTAASTGLGEYLDVINNSKPLELISEKDIISMYTLKTAKYTFEGPLLIGSVLAGANKSEASKLSKLGNMLGRAFQIQDDMLDIFLSTKDTGKPAFKDLFESKRTLIMKETYTRSDNASKKMIRSIFGKKQKTDRDIRTLLKLIYSSGSGIYCLKLIKNLISCSERSAADLKMRPKYRSVIEELIKRIKKNNGILEKRILDHSPVQ